MEDVKYLGCNHNLQGLLDGCLLFDPSDSNPLLCDCCDCHRSFHLPVCKSAPEAGSCTKLVNGVLDGCQIFLPSDENARKCQACNCHRSFHKPPPPVVENQTPGITSVNLGSNSRMKSLDVVALDDDVATSLGSFRKKMKSDHESDGLTSNVKVKLEFPEIDEDSSALDLDSSIENANNREPDLNGIPKKLKKNWEMLSLTYPECKFGRFFPRLSKDAKKTTNTWIIWCEPCQREMCINPGSSYNLSNFEVHLQPRKSGRTGSGTGTKHEEALAEQSLNTERQKEVIEKQKEVKAALEASNRTKCELWIAKHAHEGAEMIDNVSWKCTLCEYIGKFGQGDTVGVHMKGSSHLIAKKNKAANTSQKSQLTLAASIAKGVKAGTALYPLNFLPSPADIPRQVLSSYIQQKLCHGFYDSYVLVNRELVDITSLRNDLRAGELWYADPYYSQTIMVERQEIQILGTFRHRDCTRIFCEMCPLIPGLPDFRSRLHWLQKMTIPRGERVAEQGTNLEHLQREELIGSIRTWENRAALYSDQIFLLNRSLTRVNAGKCYLEKKIQSTLQEGVLPEIVELFRKAVDCGAFEKRKVLYSLLVDTASNLLSIEKSGGDGRGKRYHPSTVKLFEILQNFGGSGAHNFLSKNLVGPVLNTTQAIYKKEGFLYTVGLNVETFKHLARVLAVCKQRMGISGPILFECSEDETKCVELATLNRHGDFIDGFCGPKCTLDTPHQCTFDPKPSAGSWDSITDAFRAFQIGTMCRVMVANPLAQGIPRLVYGILTTCNKFNAVAVKKQWDKVAELHKAHLEVSVGPLRGHASDGDARRRKLMLESIYKGTFGLESDGFLMKAEVIDACPLIMMQDPIHVGKKLRNPLLSPRKAIFWGHFLAHKNHLHLITELFKRDEHGLLEEDINVKDKQNFPAVQRISFPCVRDCLEKLNEGLYVNGIFQKECVTGTITHLEVIWAFIEIFHGRTTMYERVLLASFVCHMLYFGSEYILGQKNGHTIVNNWLSRETRTDCLIACHGAVNYIRMMRDHFSHLPCPLSLVGSDCCEDFFSLLGQQVKNKHTFCVGEAVERCSHIGRTEQVKYDDSGVAFVQSRRRKNIWWENNAHVATANLGDYGAVSDENLIKAWNEGILMAMDKAERCNMKATLIMTGKWTFPCPLSFSHISLANSSDVIKISKKSVVSDSVEASHMNLATRVETRLLTEASIIIQSAVLNDQQAVTSTLNCKSQMPRHLSTIEVPGKGPVYKMRVISELNVHQVDKLPLDRLRRVRYKSFDNNAIISDDDQVHLGLFDDIGLLIHESNGNLGWHIARVQKIVKAVGEKGAQVDYVRSVSLSDQKIKLLLKYYKQISDLDYIYGGYEGVECDLVGLEAVICIISIIIDIKRNVYTLASEDRDALEKHLEHETLRLGLDKRVRRKTNIIPKDGRPPKIPLGPSSPVRNVKQRSGQVSTPNRRSARLQSEPQPEYYPEFELE